MCSLFRAKDMGIDLGTANTLIFVKGSGIVLNEPSVIAVNDKGKTLAVGAEAKAMLGKAPANISVVRPLQDGVISDFDRTADMLKAFLETALAVKKIRNFRVVVGVPSGVTEVEKRAVEEIVRQMGATEVFILEEPMAAAIGAGMPVDGTTGCMIADIGGGTSDIAIIALGGIVASTSIRHAGDKMNEAIIQYMRKRHALLIGEHTAEALKVNIGCACMDVDENGNEKRHGFIIIAGSGFDAEIMMKAAPTKNDIGEIAYSLSALATPNPTVAHFTIEHDGIVEELDGICCMAGNTSVIQNDINLFPNCRMDDGMVDIVVIEPVRTMQLLPTVITAALDPAGKVLGRPQFKIIQTKEAKITCTPSLGMQFDGEIISSNSGVFGARALPQCLDLIVDDFSPLGK